MRYASLLDYFKQNAEKRPVTMQEVIIDLWYPNRKPDFGPAQAKPLVQHELQGLLDQGLVEELHEDGDIVYRLADGTHQPRGADAPLGAR